MNGADPYAFQSLITSFDTYLFAEGRHYNIYEKLGAHPMTIDGVQELILQFGLHMQDV